MGWWWKVGLENDVAQSYCVKLNTFTWNLHGPQAAETQISNLTQQRTQRTPLVLLTLIAIRLLLRTLPSDETPLT